VYIMDVRGRGLSEAGPDIRHGVDVYASDVEGLVSELGLEQYTLLGHSMGARVGARFASRGHPGLRAVILADPPVSGPGRRDPRVGCRRNPQNGPFSGDRAVTTMQSHDPVR